MEGEGKEGNGKGKGEEEKGGNGRGGKGRKTPFPKGFCPLPWTPFFRVDPASSWLNRNIGLNIHILLLSNLFLFLLSNFSGSKSTRKWASSQDLICYKFSLPNRLKMISTASCSGPFAHWLIQICLLLVDWWKPYHFFLIGRRLVRKTLGKYDPNLSFSFQIHK